MRPRKARRLTIVAAVVFIMAVPALVICLLYRPFGSEASQTAPPTCYHVPVANGTTTSGAAMTFESMANVPHTVATDAFESFRTANGIAPGGSVTAKEFVVCSSADGQNVEIHTTDLQGS